MTMDLITLRTLIRRKVFKADSDIWAMVIDPETGETVAHLAAIESNLPSGFSQWHIADSEGRTVAQIAAVLGDLPLDNLNVWSWIVQPEDLRKNTIAHLAAFVRGIPEGGYFNQWDSKNKNGDTVAEMAVLGGNLPANSILWTWIIDKKTDDTLAHWAADQGWLPADFYQWNLTNKKGEAVWEIHQWRRMEATDETLWWMPKEDTTPEARLEAWEGEQARKARDRYHEAMIAYAHAQDEYEAEVARDTAIKRKCQAKSVGYIAEARIKAAKDERIKYDYDY
jgi:hypothetical protein